MAAVHEVLAGMVDAFDAVRREFWGENAKLVILRRDGQANQYEVLHTAASGWWAEDPSGANILMKLADITAATSAHVRNAGFVMIIDSELPGMNNVVCEIRGATTPPTGTQPCWLLRTRNIGRVFLPPNMEN